MNESQKFFILHFYFPSFLYLFNRLTESQSVFSTTCQYPPLSGPIRLSIPSVFILAICFSTALGVMPIRSARATALSELS